VQDLYPDAPPNAIALTIDDGPDPAWTPLVLDELARNGVSATFSMIGRWTLLYPDLARAVIAAGHTICNHSMTHPVPFASLSPARIEAEVAGASTAIRQAIGWVPEVFRAPGGSWSPAVLTSVASNGMRAIEWDLDPRDWQRPGTSLILSRLLAARPGDILLCHDGGGDRSETVAALRSAIPALRSRGLVFVTL
jgi:peptidoglycan/xylan/chitin deacetylase (PgdA/CDA1 family)